jgi:CHAD domain-containing protein
MLQASRSLEVVHSLRNQMKGVLRYAVKLLQSNLQRKSEAYFKDL